MPSPRSCTFARGSLRGGGMRGTRQHALLLPRTGVWSPRNSSPQATSNCLRPIPDFINATTCVLRRLPIRRTTTPTLRRARQCGVG